MSKRVVTLPNGKKCGLGVYVSVWKKIRTLDPKDRVKGFEHFAEDADYILRELRIGMHDRINRHIAGYGKGRKWDQDWQRHVRFTAGLVNTPRLIVRWVPWDLRERLAYRITVEDF